MTAPDVTGRDPATGPVDAARREAKSLIDTLAAGAPPPGPEALRRLILTPGDDEEDAPPLSHEAAARITGRDRGAIPALVEALWPVLPDLVRAGEARAVALLCVLRAFLGGRTTQEAVSRAHLSAWPDMTLAEVGLTCTVMFDAEAFGANRDDLLGLYPDRAASEAAGLAPSRLLVLEWLSGVDRADAASVAAMARGWDALPGSERRALRMLALRHGAGAVPPEGPPDDGGAYAGLRRAVAWGRPAPGTGDAAPLRRVSTQPWQALEAARGLAAPALRMGRAPRVALCVSGQLRGWREAWSTWRRRLLPGAEVEVFVQSWPAIGRAGAEPFRYVLPFEGDRFCGLWREIARAEGMDAMRAALPALFAAMEASGTVTEDAVREVYDTPHVVLDDETEAPFDTMSNQRKMHYKIHAAAEMARSVGGFDLHLRMRPDLPVRLRAFGWGGVRAAARGAPVLWAEKSYGLHYGKLMIGDQFALGTPEAMQPYEDAWTHFPMAAASGLMACPAEFTGHVSLALTAWMHGVRVMRVPLRFGALRDAELMRLPETIAALEADAAGGGGPAPRLIEAARADLAAR